MYYHQPLPFGAELLADGRVRFRLWAPSVEAVELCLFEPGHDTDKAHAVLALDGCGGGWFQLDTDRAGPGSRYCYRLPGRDGLCVPDPASRFNPADVHSASEVIDPKAFRWRDGGWRGRPWGETVIYELHVGTFSPEGTYAGVKSRLEYLRELGVTAIELMPLADSPGRHNWGYDGVLPFAPEAYYGRPEDLKDLIQAAHDKGLMVFHDVVYNHFGPEGNYLHAYAEAFFNRDRHTPWGAAINYDSGPAAAVVRDYFIHNALYWLEEYRFDGLRLDAVHAIEDRSEQTFLQALAAAVRDGPGREREIHLVLENDDNVARLLERDGVGQRPRHYVAQWNDDCHHALHVLVSGENDGYYKDYADRPVYHLGRCLAEGFAYQGEASAHREGAARGEPSAHLPASAFVNFIQNHDQIGNRAFGERIHQLVEPQALRAALAVLLLAPSPPLLFMGEEFAAATPFLFFCDFGPELAQAVTDGRRREFARFEAFRSPERQAEIPDPNDAATFYRSKLDWDQPQRPEHRAWLAYYRRLLAQRLRHIVPLLRADALGQGRFQALGTRALWVSWPVAETSGDDGLAGGELTLLANLGDQPVGLTVATPAGGDGARLLFGSDEDSASTADPSPATLPPWTTRWWLSTGVRGA